MTTACQNAILASLSPDQRNRITNASELVDLPKRFVLSDVNQRVDYVYFIESGLASIVNPMKDGSALETSLCGPEGMVGLPLFLDTDRSINQTFQQIAGSAWKLDRGTFLEELNHGPDLRKALGRFTTATMAMMSQNSACGRRHSVEERCVNWLLQIDDRITAPFHLTHQFLSQMLGVRRATVTVIAVSLQHAELISYHRGHVTITNRAGMLDIVCECYPIIRNEYARLYGEPAGEEILRPQQTVVAGLSALGDGA